MIACLLGISCGHDLLAFFGPVITREQRRLAWVGRSSAPWNWRVLIACGVLVLHVTCGAGGSLLALRRVGATCYGGRHRCFPRPNWHFRLKVWLQDSSPDGALDAPVVSPVPSERGQAAAERARLQPRESLAAASAPQAH